MRRLLWVLVMLPAAMPAQLVPKLTLSKTRYASGEPIWLDFEVKNLGANTQYFHAGDPYSFCGGFHLDVTQGSPPNNSSCATGFGGSCISGTHKLIGGAAEHQRLLVNYDHDFSKPGRYHLKAVWLMRTAASDTTVDMLNGHEAKAEEEFDIDIGPRDDAALQAELAPYLAQLNSKNEHEVREAARVLSSTAPPFIESTLLSMLDRPTTQVFAIDGLRKVNTPPSREALAKLARGYIEKYSYASEAAARALDE